MYFRRSIAALGLAHSFVWTVLPTSSIADVLRSVQECTIGKHVATSDGHQGTITRVDKAWSYCFVRQDDTGREVEYLYSLLQANDQPPAVNQLEPGIYICSTGGIAAGFMAISGRTSYSYSDTPGQYHVELSGRVVFETGPFSGRYSKMLSTTRIGLGADGDVYFRSLCYRIESQN